MSTVSDALSLAIRHHQSGDVQQAERIYRQILQADANNFNALHLLGLIALQVGRIDAAVDCISQALRLMPDFAEAHFNLGLALRRQGKLAEAMASWRQALRYKPDYAEAHHNLAAAFREQGQLEEANANWQRAIHFKPDYPDALHSLANVLTEMGKLDDAVAAYKQAVRLDPNSFRALNNLGFALIAQGKSSEAAGWLREALRLKPDYVQAHNNLGNALVSQGQSEEALACYQFALRLDPNFAAAYNNVGKILLEQDRLDEAAADFQQALRLQPDFVEALNNLGNVFLEQGKFAQAIAKYRNVLQLNPNFAAAYNNLGKVFLEQEKLADAVAILQQALRVSPDFAEAYNNLGLIHQEQGRIPEAIAYLQQALRLNPDYADAHKNLGMAWLLVGNWELGWPEYEWRLKTKGEPRPNFRQQLWDGTSLSGKTILLHTEQGFGDTLQFVRFAQLVKQRGGTVLVNCQPALVPLLASCSGIDRLIAQGEALPDFDVHAPLMSLPGILATPLAAVSAKMPYLFADPKLVDHWRRELSELDTFKIGIAWQGNPKYRRDRQRSIPLAQFAPLAQPEGIQLFSLQRGPGTEQLTASAERVPVTVLGGNLDEASGAFMDTAAIMRNLDLVITSDSAVAHLAGGLGVSVWLATPFAPDWRWLLQREDSPWYPTMRLFRQPEPRNWPAVFERMAIELRKHSRKKHPGVPPAR
jgi:tetratricopeptide (TPR) repeat protein